MRLSSATAAPLYLEVENHELWFSPLKLRDLGIYEAWAIATFKGSRSEVLEQADTSIEGYVLLLWLSLRHQHPLMLRITIAKLLTKENVIELFDEKVLPHITGSNHMFTQQTTRFAKISDDDVSWAWVFRGLAELFNFTVEEVAEMTPDQVMMYLEQSGESTTMKFETLAEAAAYVTKLKQDAQHSSNN